MTGRKLAAPVAVAAFGALLAVNAAPGVTGLGPVRRRAFPRLAGLGRPDHVALTFDDGPDPRTTPAFLDLLAERRVRATFFLLGDMVARAPSLAAQISAAGHEVAVHGYQHRYTVLRDPVTVAQDLARAMDVIANATGVAPRWYRPPYGVLSAGALLSARRLHLTPVLWSAWGREWTPGATAATVHQRVSAGLSGGATVLLHDSDCTSPTGSANAALGALPGILDRCEADGLRVGSISEHFR